MGGLFDWLMPDDPAARQILNQRYGVDAAKGVSTRGTYGGLLGINQDDASNGAPGGLLGPLTASQKDQLLLSGIQDATQTLQGRKGDAYDQQQQEIAATEQANKQAQQEAQRKALHAQIQADYAAGDFNALRQHLLGADAAGVDLGHITAALSVGQPKYQEAGGGLYSIPTMGDGRPQQVVPPKAAAPTTRTRNDGQNQITEQWDPQSQTWTRVGIAPRFKPTVAKPDATYVPPWQR
jgi:hypothetical protein